MSSLMDNLYSMKARNVEEWVTFENRLRNTNLLVIDDLGGEDVNAPWVLQKVHSIITERYNRKKTIIITTNLNKQELENTYSGRLIDRLKSTNYYIAFNSPSQRKVMNINDLKE
jgi:DNA replication protein DnaC